VLLPPPNPTTTHPQHAPQRGNPPHQAIAQDLWQPLTALAALWSRAKEPPIRAAAALLYRCLFVGVDSTPHRQEVLQALHGHLGSGQAQEEDVALEVRMIINFDGRGLDSLGV